MQRTPFIFTTSFSEAQTAIMLWGQKWPGIQRYQERVRLTVKKKYTGHEACCGQQYTCFTENLCALFRCGVNGGWIWLTASQAYPKSSHKPLHLK